MGQEQKDRIVILDFDGEGSRLIARRIRDLGVYSELMSPRTSAERLRENLPKGLILSGKLDAEGEYPTDYDPAIFDLDIPVLGIGYGMQLMAAHFQAELSDRPVHVYRQVEMECLTASKLFDSLAQTQKVFMSEAGVVTKPPQHFRIDAQSQTAPVVAMSSEQDRLYAVQFHPESDQSVNGKEVLRNFVYKICACAGDWNAPSFIKEAVRELKRTIGTRKVLCALSGGVDSSVAAALIHKAVGNQLTCMFVDHGLLRKGEADSVMKTFVDQFSVNVVKVNAKERFLRRLQGVTDPEEKRKIIGNEFIRVFEEEVAQFGDHDFLAQGTLYTDVLESGTETSKTVKSHHNVGGLPDDMAFQLVEPLKTLFKDEVRRVGEALGLPKSIIWRQPFPGPGLGIRVIGEVTEEKLEMVRESDAILREEILAAGLERDVWQYFTVLTNLRSVGVTDGSRTYHHTIGIRAVSSVDGMTAEWARIPFDVLARISDRIVSEVSGVNRVVYDITSKPPATIEWE